jgi:hypothetical protein
VAGAEVQVQNLPTPSRTEISSEPPRLSTQVQEKTVTDAEGRWRIDRFGKEAILTVFGWATHPDYFTEPLVRYNGGNPEAAKQLVAGNYVFKLTRGIPVRGVVVDTDGHPVLGAKVAAVAEVERPPLDRSSLGPGQAVTIQRVDRVETTNQADGTFVLTGCRPGTNQISAEAGSFALANQKVNLANDAASLRFVLQPGHVLRLRVVDGNGAPLPGCLVYPTSLEPSQSVRPEASRGPRALGANTLVSAPRRVFRLDAGGRVAWESTPDSELRLDFLASGFESTNLLVPADGEEQVVTLITARTTAPPRLR